MLVLIVRWLVLAALPAALLGGTAMLAHTGFARGGGSESTAGQAAIAAVSGQQHPAGIPEVRADLHPVIINRPPAPAETPTGELDVLGRPITLTCADCHSTREPAAATRTAGELDEFHQGLTYAHGTLTCLTCHNADDYDTLRLADQTSLEYADVLTLCGQCHGTQMRSYMNGAHGGMTGYWDRTRGPRLRNTCTDCHDPHAPAYPRMRPTFKPLDRFLPATHGTEGDRHE